MRQRSEECGRGVGGIIYNFGARARDYLATMTTDITLFFPFFLLRL